MKGIGIAVVGATGMVGTEFLRILEARKFPVKDIKLLASKRSAGKRLSFNGTQVQVQETTSDSFKGVDLAFISVSSEVSKQLAPIAMKEGAVVIDDSSAFRMNPQVPLVVPEVNGADVEQHQGLLAIPNCSTTPLVMVLNPLHRVNRVGRVIADTYQSVSGYGRAAVEELKEQTRIVQGGGRPKPGVLIKTIAFNVIPQIEGFLFNGYTKEEQKVTDETRKIMHEPNLAISATCVRVPVLISHSLAIHVEFEERIRPDEARQILSKAPGLKVLDDPQHGEYPTPWDVAGTDDVFVGRIRQDQSKGTGLAMWIVVDNLRKGAALNAIQMAEELIKRNCLKPAARLAV
jgi:aspartate-semialdehyde dehydrogenase